MRRRTAHILPARVINSATIITMSQLLERAQSAVITPAQAKIQVDAYILDLVTKKIDQAANIHPHYQRLWQTIHTLYSAGGKRLRPYMTILMFEAYNTGTIESIIPAAAAQELLHQAMLIHDDIIDRDTIRYGIKNVSGQYEDIYRQQTAEFDHFANSSALLAGDLLISESYLQLASSTIDKDLISKAQELFNLAIFRVVGGELLDTEASFELQNNIDPVIIAEQKTASYSFISPMLIGAVLGGATDDQQEIIRRIGTSAGIAYQLRDDVLGVFGIEADTGKSSDSDIKEGKRTLLIDEFYKRASDDQKRAFEQSFKRPQATDEEINNVRSLLIETGAKRAIEDYIEKYRKETIKNIHGLGVGQSHRDMLVSLINASLERDR